MAQLDKFGNQFHLVKCTDKKDSGFSKGYFEIGKQLFKVEPSPAADGKEDKHGNPVLYWVKITKVKAQPKSNRRGF